MIPFDVARSPLPVRRTVIEASAGTGKTFTLEGLFVRHLLEGARPGGRVKAAKQILVATFTKASTQDLKLRLREGLQDALDAMLGQKDTKSLWQGLAQEHGPAAIPILERALRDFDLVTISTIHGFCKRLLDRVAFACGTDFDTEFVEDETDLVLAACADALRVQVEGEDPLPAAILRAAKLDHRQLKQHFDAWQRFPRTAIAPSHDLAEALASLQEAIDAACRAFEPEGVLEDLELHRSLASAPWQKNVARYVHRLASRMKRQRLTVLGDLTDLAVDNLRQHGAYARVDSPEPDATFKKLSFFLAAQQATDCLERARMALIESLLRDALAALGRARDSARARSFRDLIVELHALVMDPVRCDELRAAVRREWRVALLDECQDTDPLQYEVFDKLFGDDLVLVGDPKQSIYGFRGADLHAYLRAARQSEQFTLEKNHRSHPGLVTSVIRLFQLAKNHPFAEPGILIPEVKAEHAASNRELIGHPGMPMEWRYLPVPSKVEEKRTKTKVTHSLTTRSKWEPTLLNDLVDRCRSFLTGEVRISDTGAHLQPKDIAILVRSVKEAFRVQQALASAGITASIARLHDVFASDEAAELDCLMHSLLSPESGQLHQAARATLFWGRNAADLTDESSAGPMKSDLELARALRATWLKRGFMAMFVQAVEAVGLLGRMLNREDGERKLTNWFQVAELLQDEQTRHGRKPDHLLNWFVAERSGTSGRPTVEREIRLESDAKAVQILTMHSSKGLQFEVVLLPYLTNSRARPSSKFLLSRNAAGEPVLDLSSKPLPLHAENAERNRLGEELRLLYVALTRAKRRCIAWHMPDQGAPASALSWLLHFPHANGDQHGWVRDWDEQAKQRCEHWEEDLLAFGRAHADIVSVHALTLRQEDPPQSEDGVRRSSGEIPTFRPVPRSLEQGDKTVSFTSLTERGAHEAPTEHEDDAGETETTMEPPPESLFGFARGPEAGNCLHAILEHADFVDPESSYNTELIQGQLQGYGFSEPHVHRGISDPVPVVRRMLADLTQQECPQVGFALKDLGPASRKDEWRFLTGTTRVHATEVGKILATSSNPMVGSLGEEIARQGGPKEHHGFFVGKVDLLCQHLGKWWVFDWKSNHLGNKYTDYGLPQLERSMRASRYVVQYHLYLAGLHAHLQSRLGTGYRYERDIGGACYAYLRGIQGGSSAGWYVDKPDPLVIQELASMLRCREATR